jgi:hypothetical protein
VTIEGRSSRKHVPQNLVVVFRYHIRIGLTDHPLKQQLDYENDSADA